MNDETEPTAENSDLTKDDVFGYMASVGLKPPEDIKAGIGAEEKVLQLDEDGIEKVNPSIPAGDGDLPPQAIQINEDNLLSYVFRGDTTNVEVTRTERDAWLRSFNEDLLMTWDIFLPGPNSPVRFRVKSMTQYEADIVNMSVLADRKSGQVDPVDAMRQLERYQHYAVTVCVLHAFDLPFGDGLKMDPEETDAKNVDLLRNYYRKWVRPLSVTRVSRLVTAVCYAEMKAAACLKRVSDPSFWETPE